MKNLKAVGKWVRLKTIQIYDENTSNGLYIPTKFRANDKLGKYEVVSVGNIAAKEYGLKPGMIVYADRLACLNWREEYPIIKYESIIFEERNDHFYPFRGQMIVEQIDDKSYQQNKINGMLVPYSKIVPKGRVLVTNGTTDAKPGDIVLLVRGADIISSNGKTFFIYKDNMLIGME